MRASTGMDNSIRRKAGFFMTEKYLGHRTWYPASQYFPGYFNTVSSGLQGESLKILESICSKASNKDRRDLLLPYRKKGM